MSSTDSIFLRETAAVFKQYKFLADQALVQVTGDEQFFREFGPRSNSIAAIVKHVAGNLKSRWQDFLTTDGEKPDRNRDDEFVISGADSRAALMDRWEKGWAIVTKELEQLKEEDLGRTVTIRSEPHTVILAIQRSLAHTTYHVGQILYLSRTVKEGEWKWLTVAPGKSAQMNQEVRDRFSKS